MPSHTVVSKMRRASRIFITDDNTGRYTSVVHRPPCCVTATIHQKDRLHATALADHGRGVKQHAPGDTARHPAEVAGTRPDVPPFLRHDHPRNARRHVHAQAAPQEEKTQEKSTHITATTNHPTQVHDTITQISSATEQVTPEVPKDTVTEHSARQTVRLSRSGAALSTSHSHAEFPPHGRCTAS